MNLLILGAGRTGVDVANLALVKGFDVTLSDSQSETPFLEHLDPKVRFHSGPQTEDLLKEKHLLLVSPGISWSTTIIKQACARKMKIRSEVEFALQYFDGKVCGVTGTNGKSTTTAMVAHILNKSNVSALACGNIGRTVSSIVNKAQHPLVLVVELSSYQLHSSNKLPLDSACFLNFTADHLAYHGSLNNYFKAKAKIFDFCDNAIFVDRDFPEILRTLGLNKYDYSFQYIKSDTQKCLSKLRDKLSLHDLKNAAFACELASEIGGVELSHGIEAMQDFKGLPHRFNRHRMGSGVEFINDSKATNVQSTITALDSIEQPCLLLLGGLAKEESFKPIIQYKHKISQMIFFGDAKDQLLNELAADFNKILSANTLAEVFTKHEKTILNSPLTLFSPACASFDEFSNFEKRGEFFEQNMRKLLNSSGDFK